MAMAPPLALLLVVAPLPVVALLPVVAPLPVVYPLPVVDPLLIVAQPLKKMVPVVVVPRLRVPEVVVPRLRVHVVVVVPRLRVALAAYALVCKPHHTWRAPSSLRKRCLRINECAVVQHGQLPLYTLLLCPTP